MTEHDELILARARVRALEDGCTKLMRYLQRARHAKKVAKRECHKLRLLLREADPLAHHVRLAEAELARRSAERDGKEAPSV